MTQGSLAACAEDYKSLCATVVICATLVNFQADRYTDTQTESILISLYKQLSLLR